MLTSSVTTTLLFLVMPFASLGAPAQAQPAQARNLVILAPGPADLATGSP